MSYAVLALDSNANRMSLPVLRKIRDLGATTAAEPPAPEPIETVPRELTLFES